jgi:hypothetical protein
MKNYGPVKGQIQRQKKIGKAQGVKHPSLDGSKERYTTFYIWVPEREMTLVNSFNPDEAEGIKKAGEISFYQQDLACESVVKVNTSKNEKAQNYQNFLHCWALRQHFGKEFMIIGI